jgi:predicted DsbA family dithiol-disulfide isomerase
VKGFTVDHASQMLDHVTNVAEEVGLEYHMDKTVLANSFDSHRFIQFAKKNNLGDAAEEQLFHAYFTEGKNTADHDTLIDLGTKIGLEASAVKDVLESNQFAEDVRKDIYEAQQVGVRGVPFFVLDRKYAVSGAQQSDTFLGALQQSFQEWEKENPAPLVSLAAGESCDIDGNC